MTDQPPVSPTQADNEAAYAFTRLGWIKASGGITALAEAFARHRLSAIAPGGVDRHPSSDQVAYNARSSEVFDIDDWLRGKDTAQSADQVALKKMSIALSTIRMAAGFARCYDPAEEIDKALSDIIQAANSALSNFVADKTS